MRAVTIDNAEHSSLRTMAGIAGLAESAFAASGVDLTYDPLADQLGPIFGRLDGPDKLVTESSAKAGVTADYLKVGVTNTGNMHPDKRFMRGSGNRNFLEP